VLLNIHTGNRGNSEGNLDFISSLYVRKVGIVLVHFFPLVIPVAFFGNISHKNIRRTKLFLSSVTALNCFWFVSCFSIMCSLSLQSALQHWVNIILPTETLELMEGG